MLKTIMVKLKENSINRFVDGFNTFNLAQGKYQNLLGKIINRRAITFYCTCRVCAGTWLISSTVPSGFIPNEDQGMFYAIQTPPGSSLERTNDISVKLKK
jgi:HAE1 family hydrophobic/amphiphilic exporter-1